MNRLIFISIDKENCIKEVKWRELYICGVKLKKQEPPRHIWEKWKQAREKNRMAAEIKKIMKEEPFTEVYARTEHRGQTQELLGEYGPRFLEKEEQAGLLMEYVLGKIKLGELEEVVLDDGGLGGAVCGEDWMNGLWESLNYFTVITKNPEDYEELGRHIYEETGLMLQFVREAGRLAGQMANRRYRGKGKSLWIDLGDGTDAAYRSIPGNCHYIDMAGSREKERYLAVKRPDVSYYSFVKFLDTILSSTV